MARSNCTPATCLAGCPKTVDLERRLETHSPRTQACIGSSFGFFLRTKCLPSPISRNPPFFLEDVRSRHELQRQRLEVRSRAHPPPDPLLLLASYKSGNSREGSLAGSLLLVTFDP